MSLFKKRPQLQNVDYVSPPPTEILHAFADDDVSTSERAAKRRRIVDYAQDYLKGREVFIASASLKGPFEKGWKNPWRAKPVREETQAHTAHEGMHLPMQDDEMEEEEEEEAEFGVRVMVPETEARPTSKAGSDYCHDWLRRQDAQRHYPDVDDEFDVEVREAGEETPTRPQSRRRPSRFKPARPNVVPAWTADQPAGRSILSDMPAPNAQVDSLQVDMGSSVAKRSLSEQPPRRAYRDMFKVRKDDIEDSSFTKVSMIQDDLPPPKPKALARTKLKDREGPADSPGFVFRRVNDGERPFSRGSHQSNGSTTQRDNENGHSRVWTSINNVEGQEPATVADEFLEDDIEDDQVVEETILISINDEGKWPCPMQSCPKRPKPYASSSGLRKHLKAKHGVAHTTVDNSRAPPRKVTRKELETTKDQTRNLEAEGAPAPAPADVPTNEDESANMEQYPHESTAVEPAENVQVVADRTTAQQEDEDETSPSTVKAAPPPIEEDPTNLRPEAPPAEESQDSVIPADQDEDSTIRHPEHEAVLAPRPDPIISAEVPADLLITTTTTDATAPPDRQDSRAYSTFTFNTQAALLQAHQAFQDTQSPLHFSPPREEPQIETPNHIPGHLANALSAGAEDAPAPVSDAIVTPLPFRRPGIPSFFTRSAAVPPSLSRVQPASTQDLVNAAADLSFSMVKKAQARPVLLNGNAADAGKKKRISFADWGQAKPGQVGAGGSLKVVDWSPFGVTPPVALRQKGGSQPVETPLKSALARKKSNLSFSFSRTPLAPTPTPGNEQFAQNPVSSDVPSISSALYQAAQREDDLGLVVSGVNGVGDGGNGREGGELGNGGPVGGMNSQDLEHALDEAESFLSTWDFEREVGRGCGVR